MNGYLLVPEGPGVGMELDEEKLAALESALLGVPVGEAGEAIARFYEEQAIESPGVTPADLAQVLA